MLLAARVRVLPIWAQGRLQTACSSANRWMLQLKRCTRCSKYAARPTCPLVLNSAEMATRMKHEGISRAPYRT